MLSAVRPALRPLSLPAIGLGLLAVLAQAQAANLTGRVTTGAGLPVAGALVTVFNEAKDRKETVYTAQDGSYAIRSGFSGHLTVRARAHRLEDVSQALTSADDRLVELNFQMSPFKDAQALSDSLTASAHLTQVKWPDAPTRAAFVSQCNYCHQVGNALTRTPKATSAWETIIDRMEGYVGANNHMGSRFTEDAAGMRVVLEELRSRGMLFLDSRTTGRSACAAVAATVGLQFASRNVFLDNDTSAAAVRAQIVVLEQVARKHGTAIGIGHPHDGTLTALAEWLPIAAERGIAVVPLTSAMRLAAERA